MASNVTKNDDNTMTIEVLVEGDDWAKAQHKALNKMKSSLNIKGFRKGQVPASVAKKMLPAEAVYEEAAGNVAQKYFEEAIDELGITLVDRPSYTFKDASDDAITLVFSVTPEPEAKLGEYKNLGIEKASAEVTDEDLENAILNQMKANSDWVTVEDDTPAKEGDQAVINFLGKVDGEPLTSDEPEDMELIIGQGSFLKDFEDQIVGIKTGETKEFTVTFPENYVSQNLAGKPADFTVTLNELRTKELPELDDEYVAELEIPEVKTVDEYKANLREKLAKSKEEAVERKYREDLIRAVAKNAEVDIPSVMIDKEAEEIFSEFAQQLQQSGYSLKEYLDTTGGDADSIKETLRPNAEERVRTTLVLKALGKEAGLDVTPEEIDQQIDEIASSFGEQADQIKKMINRDQVADGILDQKIVEYLKSVQ